MGSLWRVIAARWLGGEGSDALSGDADLLELLTAEDKGAQPVFLVQRPTDMPPRPAGAARIAAQPDLELGAEAQSDS